MGSDSSGVMSRGPRSMGWAIAATVAGVLLLGASAYGVVALTKPTSSSAQSPGGSPFDSTDGGTSAEPSPGASVSATPSPSPMPSASAKPPSGGGGCTIAGGTPGCPAGPPMAAASGKTWKLTFSEEFNGSSYSHSKLTPCFDWNYGDCTSSFNSGREHYMPSQVRVSNGTAKLIAAPLSPTVSSSACQNGKCTYKSGLLSTARPDAGNGSDYLYKFTYGYVEARMKVPATQGFFTAFWMLPADPTFDYKYEMDILEMLGDDPTTMYMTYHYNDRSQKYAVNTGKYKNGACATKDYSKNFVRMGLDWQPDHVAWYIDGKKCGQYSGSTANVPMQLILNVMVDNLWQRQWNVGLKDPTLTRQLEVDYMRVYQQVAG
jgi:hypothetical protein